MRGFAIVFGLGLVAASAHGAEEAINPAHGFRIGFDARGVRVVPLDPAATPWEWSLSLAGDAAREVRVDAHRVELDRGRIVEWYVSDDRGLEQGFTIATKGEPHLDLALGGNLHPVFSADGRAVDFQAASGTFVLRYAKLAVFDATGRPLPSRLEGVPGGIRIAFDDAGALYPVTVDPLATSAAWSAESNQASAWYGYAAATAGDVNGDGYSDLIVGAPFFDNGQSDEGRAYLYLGSPSGLAPNPAWTAESDQANAYFGFSVSTAGDVNGDGYDDVIVGAYGYTGGEYSEGRAYVYYGSASGLAPTPGWTLEANQVGASLGYAVAYAGDVNADGYADVLIGVPYYDNGQADEGRVYAYLGSPSGLGSNPGWIVEANQASTEFGGALGAAGDVNGDGYDDVIVGARFYDNGEFNEGRAFVYLGYGEGISQFPAWTAEPDQAGASFGSSVAGAGDVDGDGYADLLVGAPDWDGPEFSEGRVYLYRGSPAGPLSTPWWTSESNQASARTGISVATAGDVNGDGYADFAVGGDGWDGSATDQGRARVYYGSEAGPGSSPSWEVLGSQFAEQFGIAVATAGDVNGDGFSDLVAGSNLYDNGQTDEGRARLFLGGASRGAYGGTALVGATPDTRFGSVVAPAGDVDGDGFSDVLVGEWGYADGQALEGRALLYRGSPTGIAAVPAWAVEGNQDAAYLGNALAAAGDVNGDGYGDVIVGAVGHDGDQTDEGRAELYLGSPSGLGVTPAWVLEGNQAGAQFGYAVAGAGDVNGDGFADVIVGANAYDDGGLDTGRAHVFLGSAAGLSTVPAWTATGGQAESYFGISVSTAGDVNGDGFADVIVGADSFDNPSPEEGRAFVYHGSASGPSPTPSWTGEPNYSNALYGWVVGTAGDVNGDGYSDVLVGAYGGGVGDYVWIYHGSPTGLPAASTTFLTDGVGGESQFGDSAATAGDVNGDGYADVIVGWNDYNGGAGRADVFFGSAAGLSTTSGWNEVGATNLAYVGRVVASAGDVDGDGFADLLIAADRKDVLGEVRVRHGNEPVSLHRIPRQSQGGGSPPIALGGRSDDDSGFTLRMLARSPGGRGRVRVQWEVKPLGAPFDGAALATAAPRDTGLGGVDAAEAVVGLSGRTAYHWRARTLGGSPLFPRSPWVSLAGNTRTESKLRTGGCLDADGDGYGADVDPSCAAPGVDCDDANPQAWSRPGETTSLGFSDKSTMAWGLPAVPGGAAPTLAYDTLRSSTPSSFASATCVESDGPDTSSSDPTTPVPAQVFFYLTRAQNACPNGLGSLGNTSAGAERAGRSCP